MPNYDIIPLANDLLDYTIQRVKAKETEYRKVKALVQENGQIPQNLVSPWDQLVEETAYFLSSFKSTATQEDEKVITIWVNRARNYVDLLQSMIDVGLDYLTLGQPTSTLSGGEVQRVKLASELHKQGQVYVLDEPSTGLHAKDIEKLLALLRKLVSGGNTVWVELDTFGATFQAGGFVMHRAIDGSKCPNCGGTLEEIMPAKDKHVLPMYACTCCNR